MVVLQTGVQVQTVKLHEILFYSFMLVAIRNIVSLLVIYLCSKFNGCTPSGVHLSIQTIKLLHKLL